MKVLALDLSSKAGWSVLVTCEKGEELKPLSNYKLEAHGLVKLGKPLLAHDGQYPYNVRRAAWNQADAVMELVHTHKPDIIVIEDTTPGRQALAQRFLEWLHYAFLATLESEHVPALQLPKVIYLKTGVWRHAMGLSQTKADAKNNKVAKKIREVAETNPELAKKLKAETGVRGRVTKKHYAVRMVNERWGLNFRIKDNDIADAILLGEAYMRGAPACDGT